MYLALFSLLVTVFPGIPLSSGPAEQLLSQERPCVLDCWVTFRGRLPLSPKKHNIKAVGCKRRNFGQEPCGLLCLHGHNVDCSNTRWLPQRLAAGAASSVRSGAAFGHKQVWNSSRTRGSWGHAEGILGLKCVWALSVNAEESNHDCGLPGPRDTVPSQWHSSFTHCGSERQNTVRTMIQPRFSRSYCRVGLDTHRWLSCWSLSKRLTSILVLHCGNGYKLKPFFTEGFKVL